MRELESLQDPALLWDVIHPVLQRYNPSDSCVATLFLNVFCQILACDTSPCYRRFAFQEKDSAC